MAAGLGAGISCAVNPPIIKQAIRKEEIFFIGVIFNNNSYLSKANR
jgi:hypothetical protein